MCLTQDDQVIYTLVPPPNVASGENLVHSREASTADQVFGTHSAKLLGILSDCTIECFPQAFD